MKFIQVQRKQEFAILWLKTLLYHFRAGMIGFLAQRVLEGNLSWWQNKTNFKLGVQILAALVVKGKKFQKFF